MNRNLGTMFKAWAARTTTNALYGKDGHAQVTVGGIDGSGKRAPIALGSSVPKTHVDYSPKKGYSKPRYPGPKWER